MDIQGLRAWWKMQHEFEKKALQIMVVEDDLDIQQAMSDILTEEGFDVRVAGNGQIALDTLNNASILPDVILLDLMMPVMNGQAFRQAQRNSARLASVPVIVVSADRNASDQAKTMLAAAFLPKPVNLSDLLDTLEKIHPLQPPFEVAVG